MAKTLNHPFETWSTQFGPIFEKNFKLTSFCRYLGRRIINEIVFKGETALWWRNSKYVDGCQCWACHLKLKGTSAASSCVSLLLLSRAFLTNECKSLHACDMYDIAPEPDLLCLRVFALLKDSLVPDEEAVLQRRCQQTFPGDDRQGGVLRNLRRRGARHEGRRSGRKLGPLCQVPAAWEMLR